jgi:inosine-uridine nucleoside N-ribohydrolase
MKTQTFLFIFCIVLVFALPAGARVAAKPGAVPVILDTDIGDDIDDTWALALLLKSPELDLKLVVTDQGKAAYRAKIVARLLEIAGRTDVSIGLGLPVIEGEGGQAPWVERYDISKYPGRVYRDGVQALIDTVMRSTVPVTLICIGPAPNIEVALERQPGIARRARFVGMYGSIRWGYDGKSRPDAEYNVKANVRACRRALGAAWGVTITPLDTCGLVQLGAERYAAVRDCRDPLVRAVIENYRIWLGEKRSNADTASSTLFDTVAVYLAISQNLLVMERLGIRITDDGFTVIDAGAKQMNCATAWRDMTGFKDFLVKRLTGTR